MCGAPTQRAGDLQVRYGRPGSNDLVGLIGLSGSVRGAVLLTMPILIGKRLASSFLGEPVRQTGPRLLDAYGELVNIIAGAANARLGGERVQMSLPTVFIGHDVPSGAVLDRPWIIIPMRFEHWGRFNLEISKEDDEDLVSR